MDETAALRDLDDRIRGVPQPNGSRMAERERRIRLAYLDGAEECRASDRTPAKRRRAGVMQTACTLIVAPT
jgi:hypothetical protein